MARPQKILTTEVSMWAETKREVGPSWLLSDVNELGLRHVLLVRFHTGEPCTCSPREEGSCICTPWNTEEGEAAFLERVREIVRRDCEEQSDVPRIDALCLHQISIRGPSREFVQAVRGLHPRLLCVDCGFGEECDLGSFNALNEIWPLKTLEIVNWCCNGRFGVHLHPAYLSRHIRSLHLHFCCDVVEFPGVGPTSTLRELSITESFALDTLHQLGASTCLLENLHTLRLSTLYGFYMPNAEPEQVVRTLERMRSLRVLEFAFGNWIVYPQYTAFRDIPKHLPGGVEVCKIRGPPDLISDIEQWVALINDENWLPDLKSFTLMLDVWGDENEFCKYDNEEEDEENKQQADLDSDFVTDGRNESVTGSDATHRLAKKEEALSEGRLKADKICAELQKARPHVRASQQKWRSW